jgi:hypothetical protein
VDGPRAGTESSHDPIGFAVRILRAVDHAKHTVRVPAIVPESHGHAILRRKLGGRQVISIEGDMGVNRAGPFGWATLVHRGHCGDSHGVGLFRLHRSDPVYPDRIIADGTGQACNPFLPGRNAGLPQIPQSRSRFAGESKGRPYGVLGEQRGAGGSGPEGRDGAEQPSNTQ